MPLQMIRQDITRMECDAIVNASNSALIPGGGEDAAVHAAAGPKLAEACRKLGGCPTGEARLTKGYNLPCKYVIHTAGPIWQGGERGERALLESCYRSALALAKRKRCKSVAFPLISAGAFGYPKDLALRVAVDCIGRFLIDNEMQIYLVVFGKEDYLAGGRLFAQIQSFIDDNYVDARLRKNTESSRRVYTEFGPDGTQLSTELVTSCYISLPEEEMPPMASSPAPSPAAGKNAARPRLKSASLRQALAELDESFQQMLLRKIDEKGMTDAQCYKKANIDRKLFSKIRKDIHYKPSKATAIAFAIALELPLPETREMLMKAGYALSHSSKFDIIIEYFIQNGNYNIFEINEALFAFDQSLLGA